MDTELTVPKKPPTTGLIRQPANANANSVVQFMEVAKLFAASELVPATYRNKPANCLIAADIANRLGVSTIAVMQNLFPINGRISWSSQFIIAMINTCGRFESLKFEMSGVGDSAQCVAHSRTKEGVAVIGPTVTIAMAKKEGWFGKSGSKWQTMPEIMLQYRAASFFGKLHCPELLFGMMSQEECEDIPPPPQQPTSVKAEMQSMSSAAQTQQSSNAEVVHDVTAEQTPAASQATQAETSGQSVVGTSPPQASGLATTEQINELEWLRQGIPVPAEAWAAALAKRDVKDVRELWTEQAEELLVKLRLKVAPAGIEEKAKRTRRTKAEIEAAKAATTGTATTPAATTTVAATAPLPEQKALFTPTDPAETEPSNAAVAGKATSDQVLEMLRYRDLLGISLVQWSAILAKKNVVSESLLSFTDADVFLANLEKKHRQKTDSAAMQQWGNTVAPDAPDAPALSATTSGN